MISVVYFIICSSQAALLPYDAVDIVIWRQPDLSGKYFVDTDTSLNIPLIGKFKVKDISIDSLETLLDNEFHKYYGDIFLNIYFLYRINIFGEVKIPGYYYMKSGDNLADLLALAGGPSVQGNLNNLRILNVGSVRAVNLEKILRSGRDIEKLNLRPGDVVMVPRRFMSALQEWGVIFTLGTFVLQVYTTYLLATQN
ncbi:MAG TPA: polysaccharide biosynthesis/export family protein [bacterium]